MANPVYILYTKYNGKINGCWPDGQLNRYPLKNPKVERQKHENLREIQLEIADVPVPCFGTEQEVMLHANKMIHFSRTLHGICCHILTFYIGLLLMQVEFTKMENWNNSSYQQLSQLMHPNKKRGTVKSRHPVKNRFYLACWGSNFLSAVRGPKLDTLKKTWILSERIGPNLWWYHWYIIILPPPTKKIKLNRLMSGSWSYWENFLETSVFFFRF